MLPCDISVPRRSSGGLKKGDRTSQILRDELTLIMWYREDVKTPIYSIDVRSGEKETMFLYFDDLIIISHPFARKVL